jgi:hypothetical protein
MKREGENLAAHNEEGTKSNHAARHADAGGNGNGRIGAKLVAGGIAGLAQMAYNRGRREIR